MNRQEFDQLQVGDFVCLESQPLIKGFIEDINREKGFVEFDQDDTITVNLGGKDITIQQDQEMSMSYYWIKLLYKAKPVPNQEDYKILKEKYDTLVKDLTDLLEKY